MADPSPAVAARDAEIVTAGEQLEADTGKRPTRKELANYVRRTTGQSCSAGRVTQAYRRQREAEAAGTGETVKMDRAPGAGRKKTPLVEAVVALCEAAIEVASAFEGLPRTDFVRPALRLKERAGWQEQLRNLAAAPPPPLPPEQLELALDPLESTRQQIPLIQQAIKNADVTTRRQLWPVLRDYMQLLDRLSPAPERDGKVPVDIAEIGAYRSSCEGKLAQAVSALQARVRDILDGCHQDGLMTPEAREVCRRLGHLPKESKEG